LPEFGISEEAMNSLRSFQLDLGSARALQLAVALGVSLIAACGGGGYGGGGGGGMGGMSSSAPMITAQPMSQTVTAPAAAMFSVTATSPAGYGVTYQWMRGGTNIMGATAASYTTPPTSVMADNGAMFQVKVTNAYGTTTSNTATLTVM
jgi:hypothetical protein